MNFSGLGSHSGNITKVEIILPIVFYPTLAGSMQVYAVDTSPITGECTGTANRCPAHTYDVTTLSDGLLAVNVTSDRTWAWTDFNATKLAILLETYKSGNPSGHMDMDAAGYRITTDATCGKPSDTIVTLPLTDTFDASKLQFYSANPAPTSVSGGTINWTNVGPVYAGQTKTVLVRFLALEPPNIGGSNGSSPDPTTHQNCSGTTEGKFADGAAVNTIRDCDTITINPGGEIGDKIWYNPNGNITSTNPSTNESGEVGLSGVVVHLYRCTGTCDNGAVVDDVLIKTTSTDAVGKYLFTGVPGTALTNYQVVVDATTLPDGGAGWTFNYDDNGSPWNNYGSAIPIDYSDAAQTNDNYNNADFGVTSSSPVIIGSVWHDRNNSANATRDSNEEGFANIIIALVSGSCKLPPDTSGSACPTTVTDANGDFVFSRDGNSAIATSKPYSIYVYKATAGGLLATGTWSETFDTNGTATPDVTTVNNGNNLSSGTMYRVDFSYRNTDNLNIGDTVFKDWDGDATQDAGEEGIQNVAVKLYRDVNGNGVYDAGTDTLVASQTTNSSGQYLFTGLPGGTDYLVVVDQTTLPSGYVQTNDPNETGVCTVCDSRSALPNLAASNLDQDFAYKPVGTSSIGDFVWRDLDHDGVQDGGSETGIANIAVKLYEDTDGNGVIDANDALVATTSTDANGKYLFSGLAAGRYLVSVDTADTDLPADANGKRYVLSTANNPLLVTLTAGQNYLDADFGFTPGGQIGDLIWRDYNANGVPDAGEPGISGVTVNLYTWTDTDGDGRYDNGEPVSGSVFTTSKTTDANGNYLFTSLPAGNYKVVVTPPANHTQTGDPDYCPTSASATYCFGYDNASYLVLKGGEVNLAQDLGYAPQNVAGLGEIGDTLWVDSNANGVQDAGEPGIGLVTVKLYRNGPDSLPNTADDVLSRTIQTDVTGQYLFTGLGDYAYNVRVDASTLPTGLSQTYDPDAANPCSGGSCDNIGLATLSAGSRSNLTRDFGYKYSGSNTVGGTVFFDKGVADGSNPGDIYQSGADNPFQGIMVRLYNSNRQLVGATTTNASGYYSFSSLPSGNYIVVVDTSSPILSALTKYYEPDEQDYDAGDNSCEAGSFTNSSTPGCNNYTTVGTGDTDVLYQDYGFYANMDCGDLPDTYNSAPTQYDTKLSAEGPCHIGAMPGPGAGTIYLGNLWDAEFDGQPDAKAGSDNTGGDDKNTGGGADDEDGVTPVNPTTWIGGATGRQILISKVTGNNAYLAGWFDWNNDGNFTQSSGGYDPGEYQYFGYIPAGTNIYFSFNIPSSCDACDVKHMVNARFRLYEGNSPPPVIAPTGIVKNGEVEDYQWPIGPTAVTLASFTATPEGRAIRLDWETATELDNIGFNLYRSDSPDGPYTRLNSSLIPTQNPGSPIGAGYTWLDTNVRPGVTYYYKLEDLDIRMGSTFHGPVWATVAATPRFRLYVPLIIKP